MDSSFMVIQEIEGFGFPRFLPLAVGLASEKMLPFGWRRL